MAVIVDNVHFSVRMSLTALRLCGFWASEDMDQRNKMYYNLFGIFCFIYTLGLYLVIQTVDLIIVWGDLALMTTTGFVLFTNMAQAMKLLYLMMNRAMVKGIISDTDQVLRNQTTEEAKRIVKSSNNETRLMQLLYAIISTVTISGWISSSEDGQLLFRGWYPYDVTKTPGHQLTNAHQASAIFITAALNIAKDSLVTSLVAQCRCRLRLLSLMLTNLCHDMDLETKHYLTPGEISTTSMRLDACILEHQRVLMTTVQLQTCFSSPIFAQFMVSLLIICVTAFQMVSQTGNMVRFLSMTTYLLNMMYQVFLYCYQGHQLTVESMEVADAAYQSPWYRLPAPLRRKLLLVMTRTRRPAKLTAGGFTTLSLASFMAIIKASYSLFTLLQRVEEKN